MQTVRAAHDQLDRGPITRLSFGVVTVIALGTSWLTVSTSGCGTDPVCPTGTKGSPCTLITELGPKPQVPQASDLPTVPDTFADVVEVVEGQDVPAPEDAPAAPDTEFDVVDVPAAPDAEPAGDAQPVPDAIADALDVQGVLDTEQPEETETNIADTTDGSDLAEPAPGPDADVQTDAPAEVMPDGQQGEVAATDDSASALEAAPYLLRAHPDLQSPASGGRPRSSAIRAWQVPPAA